MYERYLAYHYSLIISYIREEIYQLGKMKDFSKLLFKWYCDKEILLLTNDSVLTEDTPLIYKYSNESSLMILSSNVNCTDFFKIKCSFSLTVYNWKQSQQYAFALCMAIRLRWLNVEISYIDCIIYIYIGKYLSCLRTQYLYNLPLAFSNLHV